MANKIAISFIIPAYNASGTIERTLDSIRTLMEGKVEYEIIVVDDCSKDNTREVVRKYAQTHPAIRLISQPQNHRQGAARNRGLEIALGEYVMWVDADDAITEGVLAIYDFAKENHLDASLGLLAQVVNGLVVHIFDSPVPNGAILSGHDFAEKYFSTAINNYPVIYVWRRGYLQEANIPFEEDRRYEDGDWCNKAVYYCKTIGFVKQIVYHYYYAESVGSTTHTINPETLGDWVNMAYRQWVFAEKIREEAPLFYDKLIYSCRYIVNGHLSFRRLTRFSPKQIDAIFKRVGNEAMLHLAERKGLQRFPRLCLCNPRLVVMIMAVCHPVAQLGRLIVRLTKN